MRVPHTAILRPLCLPLTVENIKFKLEGATVFSLLDMNEGYYQPELDESNRHITTFYGTECKMRYIRLNYVTISAQDIFDKAMDDTISGLQGELYMRDDFIVFGRDNTEHDTALENLLQRVSEVRSLLGIVQYSARFIPNFAEMTTPLRKLTHQGVKLMVLVQHRASSI